MSKSNLFSIDSVRFDAQGLVPVIAQEHATGEVLMLAWANREALQQSMKTGKMHYWSRSRNELWEKGATSGNRQTLVAFASDCDSDAVLALVHQEGVACHTGGKTCFLTAEDSGRPLEPILARLADTIAVRQKAPNSSSYTAKLLANPSQAWKKIGEEGAELVAALASENPQRVAEEAADVLYHVLVACQGRGVALHDILSVLEAREK